MGWPKKDEKPAEKLKEGTFVFFIIHGKTSGLVESYVSFFVEGYKQRLALKTMKKNKHLLQWKEGFNTDFQLHLLETDVKFEP